MKRVLIFGAASAIAQATAREMVSRGAEFFLLDRDEDRLVAVKNDLIARGAPRCEYLAADLAEVAAHRALLDSIYSGMPDIDTVLIAYGTLGDQKACEQDFAITENELRTNFVSVLSLLTLLANRFEKRGNGMIAVITSVAGDRGRKSNYVYGTAKGALGIFLQGLRNRLFSSGVKILTIKPGFVDTPMTAGLKQGMLYVQPEVVGQGICRAIEKGKDVVYVPWFWQCIMLVIRHIPEVIFKRLSL